MSSNKPMRAVVIGSGFGGSVSASRLVGAGIDVTLLERGPGVTAYRLSTQVSKNVNLCPEMAACCLCFDQSTCPSAPGTV